MPIVVRHGSRDIALAGQLANLAGLGRHQSEQDQRSDRASEFARTLAERQRQFDATRVMNYDKLYAAEMANRRRGQVDAARSQAAARQSQYRTDMGAMNSMLQRQQSQQMQDERIGAQAGAAGLRREQELGDIDRQEGRIDEIEQRKADRAQEISRNDQIYDQGSEIAKEVRGQFKEWQGQAQEQRRSFNDGGKRFSELTDELERIEKGYSDGALRAPARLKAMSDLQGKVFNENIEEMLGEPEVLPQQRLDDSIVQRPMDPRYTDPEDPRTVMIPGQMIPNSSTGVEEFKALDGWKPPEDEEAAKRDLQEKQQKQRDADYKTWKQDLKDARETIITETKNSKAYKDKEKASETSLTPLEEPNPAPEEVEKRAREDRAKFEKANYDSETGLRLKASLQDAMLDNQLTGYFTIGDGNLYYKDGDDIGIQDMGMQDMEQMV